MGRIARGKWEIFQRGCDEDPGLKLLEFYQGMCKAGAGARLDTKETMKGSESMKNLKAVDGEWMRLWLRQWAF
jgi:hypothetical protein